MGSSASTMAGRPTRARAMATRWRCPPESWVGRAWGRSSRPTSVEGVEGSGAPFGLGDPGVEEPVGHVVEHALVLGQEELLEHEADPGGPQGGQLAVGQAGDVETGDPHVPGAGPVQGCPSGATGWSCPTPTGRRCRPARPRATVKVTPAGRSPAARSGRPWSPGRLRAPAERHRRGGRVVRAVAAVRVVVEWS